MTAPGAAALIRAVGLLVDGPVPWGRPVRSTRPGVYLVELPAPLDHPPLDLALVGKWLERATDLLLDGTRPTSKALLARVGRDWLPGQTVLFAGSTNGSLAERVAAVQATRPGDPLPCPDGLRLHLLRGIERCTTWWAETDAPEEYEDALLDAFAAGLDAAVAGSPGGFAAPFAVLRRPTGEERPSGISGAVTAAPDVPTPPPPRVVQLPPASAGRHVGAPAPRAVARDGAPATRRPPAPRTEGGAGASPTRSSVPASAAAPAAETAAAPPAVPDGQPGVEALHLSPEGARPPRGRAPRAARHAGGRRSFDGSRPPASTVTSRRTPSTTPRARSSASSTGARTRSRPGCGRPSSSRRSTAPSGRRSARPWWWRRTARSTRSTSSGPPTRSWPPAGSRSSPPSARRWSASPPATRSP